MREVLSMNEWTVSGEVFYLRPLDTDFAASVKIRGTARRQGLYYSQILEIPCLMSGEAYSDGLAKGLGLYKSVTLAGHLESWVKDNGKSRLMLVCDRCVRVG